MTAPGGGGVDVLQFDDDTNVEDPFNERLMALQVVASPHPLTHSFSLPLGGWWVSPSNGGQTHTAADAQERGPSEAMVYTIEAPVLPVIAAWCGHQIVC